MNSNPSGEAGRMAEGGAKAKRDADHLWHVWMNRRNFGRPENSPHEHSLYEFKAMLEFLRRDAGGKVDG
jgi:hypothetical protein